MYLSEFMPLYFSYKAANFRGTLNPYCLKYGWLPDGKLSPLSPSGSRISSIRELSTAISYPLNLMLFKFIAVQCKSIGYVFFVKRNKYCVTKLIQMF